MSFILVAFGYVLFQEAETNSKKYYLSIFGMVFFGFGLAIGLYKIFRTNLILRISANGIYHRKNIIKWEEILETQAANSSHQDYINL